MSLRGVVSFLRRVVSFLIPQHWPETLLTLGITAAAIAPGIVTEGTRYDPGLAILAITAIAVVWYTGSTQRALGENRLDRLEKELRDLQEILALLDQILAHAGSLPDSPDAPDLPRYRHLTERAEEQLMELRFVLRGRWNDSIKTSVRLSKKLRNIIDNVCSLAEPSEYIRLHEDEWAHAKRHVLETLLAVRREVGREIDARKAVLWGRSHVPKALPASEEQS